jgi:hypothetical protein
MGTTRKKIWGKIWPSALGPAYSNLWAVVIVVGAIIWAWIKKWFASPYAPLMIPSILIVLLIYFALLNQIKKWRRGRTTNYQELIMKWLYKYQYSVQRIVEENTEWTIKSTHKEGGIPFIVSAYKTEPDFITIAANSKLEPSEQAAVDIITAQPNSILIEDLRIEMSRLGFEHQGLKHPLRVVSIAQKMAKDNSLTELMFLQTALRVRSAQGLYINVISKYRKLNPPSSSSSTLVIP